MLVMEGIVIEKMEGIVGSTSEVVGLKNSLGVGKINVDVSGILEL